MVLRRFAPDEIKLSQQDAFCILRFFRFEPGRAPGSLTVEDRGFAQALLVEAIDRSYDLAFAELMFRSSSGDVPADFASVRPIVRQFARGAASHWFRHATVYDLARPEIYESVRSMIACDFRTAWAARAQRGQLVY